MLGSYLTLKRTGVLGLNARNGNYILAHNRRRFYPLVEDKVLCKRCLQDFDLAVPELIGVVESMRGASHLEEALGGDHP